MQLLEKEKSNKEIYNYFSEYTNISKEEVEKFEMFSKVEKEYYYNIINELSNYIVELLSNLEGN